MKINKKSWHYWLNDVTDSKLCSELRHGNVGLCDYFWGTVKSFIKAISFLWGCLIIGAGILLLTYVGTTTVVFLITGVLGYPLSWVDYHLAVAAVIFITLISLIGGFAAWIQDEIEFAPNYMKIKSSPVKYKKPSLVGSYYSAWKDKVCPLVELED